MNEKDIQLKLQKQDKKITELNQIIVRLQREISKLKVGYNRVSGETRTLNGNVQSIFDSIKRIIRG